MAKPKPEAKARKPAGDRAMTDQREKQKRGRSGEGADGDTRHGESPSTSRACRSCSEEASPTPEFRERPWRGHPLA
jgi:hypothetical protein